MKGKNKTKHAKYASRPTRLYDATLASLRVKSQVTFLGVNHLAIAANRLAVILFASVAVDSLARVGTAGTMHAVVVARFERFNDIAVAADGMAVEQLRQIRMVAQTEIDRKVLLRTLVARLDLARVGIAAKLVQRGVIRIARFGSDDEAVATDWPADGAVCRIRVG
jgi:hypothetical protein